MSTNQPKVSIVVATYNRCEKLKEAIQSVLSQSFSNWELIVVDDGSEDETPQLLSHYSSKDSRIRFKRQDNQGVAAARNEGIRLATSEFISFLDDDDLWLPEKLEKQIYELEARPAHALNFTWCWREDDNAPGRKLEPPQKVDATYRRLFSANFIPTPSAVLIRRRALAGNASFNEIYHGVEDYDLWLRLASQFPFSAVEEPLTIYRRHSGSVSRKTISILEQMIQCLGKAPLTDGVTADLKDQRVARLYYQLATELRDRKNWKEAAKAYLESVRLQPAIGLEIPWARMSHVSYRFFRPYAVALNCWVRSL